MKKINQWENKTNSRPAENIKDQSKTRQDLLRTNMTGNATKRTGNV
jgi:hypothetical protein